MKKQATETKADVLRKSIRQCGFNRRQLAAESRVGYRRLYRIMKEGVDPTLDEAAAIQEGMQRLINAAIDQMNAVPVNGSKTVGKKNGQ